MANRWAGTSRKTATVGASATVSFLVHTLLIGAAVIATAPDVVLRHEIPEVFSQLAQFLAPPERLGGQEGQREQLKFVALGEPSAVVRGDKLVRPEDATPIPERKISGLDIATM